MWQWPGDIRWHFVNIPREQYEIIRAHYPRGMVHISATLGKTSWDTALFPHTNTKSYILPIKQVVRKKENIWAGDLVTIKITQRK